MSTNHNRIKVADLETNEPNKTLITNDNGELEFSDITGAQDLNSVLINGNIAYGSRASGGASTLIMNPDAQNSYSNNFSIYRGTTDSNIYQDPLQIYIDNRNSIGGSRIRTSTSGIEISQDLTDFGKTTVKISDPIATTTINFPAKPEGTYTLATLNDISDEVTFQKALSNAISGVTAGIMFSPNGLNNAGLIFEATDLSSGSGFIGDFEDNYASIGVNKGKIDLLQIHKDGPAQNVVRIYADNPIADVNYIFPAKPAGDYTIATLDDIISTDNFVSKTGEVSESIDGNKRFVNNVTFRGQDTENWIEIQERITFNENGGNAIHIKPNIGLDGEFFHTLPAKSGTYAMLDDITAGSQNLQDVLNEDKNAQFESSYINFLSGDVNNRAFEIVIDNGSTAGSGKENSFLLIENGLLELQTENDTNRGTVGSYYGELELSQYNKTNNKKTSVQFNSPLDNTFIKFPAKSAGTYTLATLDDVSAGLPADFNYYSNPTSLNLGIGGNSIMSDLSTGGSNLGIAEEALKNNTTGESNTGLGPYAMSSNTTGSYNTAVGYAPLTYNTTGNQNTGIGTVALFNNTTGTDNTAVGNTSLYNNTTGIRNTGVGSGSFYYSTTGSSNVAVGYAAGMRINGQGNTAVGDHAYGGSSATPSTGNKNITIGFQAGRDITSGSNNILLENIINQSITSGNNNIIINPKNKAGISTGNGNTIIGGFDGTFGSADSELVVLASGTGKVAIRKNTNDELIAPNLTNALISSGGNKSLLTLEYLNTKIGTTAPTSATATGTVGEIRVAAGYIYWCTAPNTWIRAAGSTF